MSQHSQAQRLKAQIIQTEHLLSMVGNHPTMAESMRGKLKNLQDELNAFESLASEPKIKLLFSGNAVNKAQGIKSSFVSKILQTFQELIQSETEQVRNSKNGKKASLRSELYLTALPIGSFGIELTKLDSEDLLDNMDVADSMVKVMNFINDFAGDDEKFEKSVESVSEKSLQNLKKLLREVKNEDSILRIESGNHAIAVTNAQVAKVYDRVASVTKEEIQNTIIGTLRGILLDSGRFEAQDEAGNKISGITNQALTENQLIDYNATFLNKSCNLNLKINQTIFKNGKKRETYELLSLTSIENHPSLM